MERTGYVLFVQRVSLFQLLQYPHLDLACVAIFWNSTNDLDSYASVVRSVDSFDNFAKGALT